ncbi:MAG: SEL1-like repeat protein [Planctomycetaceae bacterium]|nr:SEL1-like repeat protein [Planctomycetaceae bacterium]
MNREDSDDKLENRPTRVQKFLESGMYVGSYLLDRPLGKGGMGEVWRAVDPTRGDESCPGYLALKFLPQEIQDSPRELRRALETFRAVQALQHPNICPVYFLQEFPRFGHVLAMKFIDGMNLLDYRDAYVNKHGSFPLSEVIRILTPVAAALDYAHRPGRVHNGVASVIHRDLKPENILITQDGREVQIVDFGLATQVRLSLSRVSKVEMDSVGTRPYMAPEQWRGQHQDDKTDQYALAVVAYELLADRLPFEVADPFQLRECVLNEPVPLLVDQPASVNQALAKALSKLREERFESCLAFLDSICCEDSIKLQPVIREDVQQHALQLAEHLERQIIQEAYDINAILGDPIEQRSIEIWKALAKQGSVECQFVLGYTQIHQQLTESSFAEGLYWLDQASENGHIASKMHLGLAIWRLSQGPKNEVLGRKLLTEAADSFAQAARWLGRLSESDSGAPHELQVALDWYLKAIELGDTPSKFYAGRLVLEHGDSLDTKPNIAQALEWVQELADNGFAEAQCLLGMALFNGQHGLEVDKTKAIKYCKLAADQGDNDARCFLALRYLNGDGVAKTPRSGIDLLRLAVANGSFIGTYLLACELISGENCEPNVVEAIALLEQIADSGDFAVIRRLVHVYNSGEFMERNSQKAYFWARKLAELGEADGQCFVGRCYETGDGVVASRRHAILWLRKSAEAGNLDAMKCLARVVWNEGNVNEDEMRDAIHWAGMFIKRRNRIIDCNTINDTREVMDLLGDISKVALDALRFDLSELAMKAMLPFE